MKSKNAGIVRTFYFVLAGSLLATVLILLTTRDSHADRSIYTGSENHVVTLNQAQGWTAKYQEGEINPKLLAGYFGRSIFDNILTQKRCVGIRIYNAKHENGAPVFVLVGVDESGKDIVSGPIGEGLLPCPPYCPTSSPLLVYSTQALAIAN
jgi:hypothetical protein